MKVEINTLTSDIFLELYTSVGWEPPCIEQVNVLFALWYAIMGEDKTIWVMI